MRVEKTDKPHGSVRYCGTYVCTHTHIYVYTIGDIAACVRGEKKRPRRLWKKGI